MVPIRNFSDFFIFRESSQEFKESPFYILILYKSNHHNFRQYVQSKFFELHHNTAKIACLICDSHPEGWEKVIDTQYYYDITGEKYQPQLNDFEIDIMCHYLDISTSDLPCVLFFQNFNSFSYDCFSLENTLITEVDSFFNTILEKTSIFTNTDISEFISNQKKFLVFIKELKQQYSNQVLYTKWDRENKINDRMLNTKARIKLRRSVKKDPPPNQIKKIKNTEEIHQKAIEAEAFFPGVKIMSQSRLMDEIKIRISKFHKIPGFKGPILILGERGTGKSYLAKAIHDATKRKGAFVKVDCGSLTETLFESELFGHKKGSFTDANADRQGAFESAQNGTIFLDEIGNIGKNIQKKLLGVLNDWSYKVVGSNDQKQSNSLVILATNENVPNMIERGLFRTDLYDRINGEIIQIPPLNERKEDIPLFLENNFLDLESGLEKDVVDIDYHWPGNVRELMQVIERIKNEKIMYDDKSPVALNDFLFALNLPDTKTHIPFISKNKLPGNMKATDDQIIEALKKYNGNKSQAAAELGMTYHGILYRCKNSSAVSVWLKSKNNQF